MTAIDHNLFLALNFDGGAFADAFFRHVSGKVEWAPLYLLILYLIYRREGWRGMLLAAAFIALAVAAADQICNLFKYSLGLDRLRPGHTGALAGQVHLVNDYRGGLSGTMSAHAATVFAIAVFTCRIIRSHVYTALIFLWALLVCYSRIYLGLHFPLDLLYGAANGTLLGLLALWGYRRTAQKMKL